MNKKKEVPQNIRLIIDNNTLPKATSNEVVLLWDYYDTSTSLTSR